MGAQEQHDNLSLERHPPELRADTLRPETVFGRIRIEIYPHLNVSETILWLFQSLKHAHTRPDDQTEYENHSDYLVRGIGDPVMAGVMVTCAEATPVYHQ